jgi:kynurenine formamidase
VDVPYHFLAHGRTVDAYPPEAWIFTLPWMIELDVRPGQLIGPEDLPWEDLRVKTADILLLKTGFEKNSHEEVYWKEGPGLLASLADHLKRSFPL